MSLPSTTRHRWGLEDGGNVGFLDLGDAIVIVPGGTEAVRRRLLDAITSDDWQFARAGFGDDELTSQ
jgi:bifunctional DNA-binding transcriptional regulator/antitoxin component of YhaV-PrlF toxin-antitoxin module